MIGLPDAAQDADRAAIRRVIDAWGFLRDQGDWEGLSQTFQPDGRIAVSWFKGDFAAFVDACRAGHGRTFSKHVMCGGRITLSGARAVAETDVLLFTRGLVAGQEWLTQTNMRFLDLCERRGDGIWRIADRAAIYDHDAMWPAPPAGLPAAAFDGLPPGQRFLSWRLRAAGRQVPPDLPAPGNAAEAALRAAAQAWISA